MEAERNVETKKRTIVPVCDIEEQDGSVGLRSELPGIPKENVEVRIDREELEVSGSVAAPDATGTYLVRERRVGDYRKVFTLDDTIDLERIDASFSNGVVTLTLKI